MMRGSGRSSAAIVHDLMRESFTLLLYAISVEQDYFTEQKMMEARFN
jgi:hypothetical protein